MNDRLPTIPDQSYAGSHRQATRQLLIDTVAESVGQPLMSAVADRPELEHSTPDFDVAAHARSTTKRTRSLPWLAVAATVVIVGGGAAALYGHGTGTGTAPAAGSSDAPQPATVPTIVGAMIAPMSDPRQLMIVTTGPAVEPGSCTSIGLSVHVTESSTEIRISSSPGSVVGPIGEPASITATAVVVAGPDSTKPAVLSEFPTVAAPPSHCASPDIGAIVTGLKHPLGSRSIVDDATGQPIPLFEPKPLVPTDVPAGYDVPDGYTIGWRNMDPMESATLDSRPGALAPLAALGSLYKNAAGVRLDVITAPSDAVNPGARTVDHTTVDGHDATVTETDQTRCVTWSLSPQSARQVCSDIKQANPNATAADLLSESDLLQVARSLP